MKGMARAAMVAAGFMLVAAGAEAKPPKVVRKVPVDKYFTEGEFKWTGGIGGYKFLWSVRAVNGKLEVCGVGHYQDAYSRSQNNDILRKSYVTLNGKKILKDMRFFSIAKYEKDLRRTPANCASTGVKVPKGKVEIQLRSDGGRYSF